MTLPDPIDVIAPRDGAAYDTVSFLQQMLEGTYSDGIVLEYYGLQLYSRGDADAGARIYDIYTEDGAYIETMNLSAFRTVTEIERFLDEIVAYDPSNRDEWVAR